MIQNAYRSFFLVFFFFLTTLFGGIPKNVLEDPRGQPSTALLEVLRAFSVPNDGSWNSIRDETQKWIQQGKERWEFENLKDENPTRSYGLFSTLFMTQNIYPEKQRYDYAVILGSTVQRMRARFWFLKEAWDKGLRFRSLVVLTGDRPLSLEFENEKTLLDPNASPYPFRKNWVFDGHFPKNETEIAKLIFDQLDLPESWRHMNVVFVDTPRPPNTRRPNTADTFDYWMSFNPKTGSVLSVSNQPFVGRQDLVARKHLLNGFDVETIGPGFTTQEYLSYPNGLAILLNELASWIYELVPVANTPASLRSLACLYERYTMLRICGSNTGTKR